jgi:thymidylate synthase ThyX
MQADSELQGARRKLAIALWLGLRYVACVIAWLLARVGLHKQAANRLLEPWIWVEVIVSSTEWRNFFDQRDHHMAQPEFRELAKCIRAEYDSSIPTVVAFGDWHLPFIDRAERAVYGIETLKKISAARCAAVSYGRFEIRPIEKDLNLFDRLAANWPPHLSPLEHVATPMTNLQKGNLREWSQLRAQYEIKRIDR